MLDEKKNIGEITKLNLGKTYFVTFNQEFRLMIPPKNKLTKCRVLTLKKYILNLKKSITLYSFYSSINNI